MNTFDPTKNRRVVCAAMINSTNKVNLTERINPTGRINPPSVVITSPRHWDSICHAILAKLPRAYQSEDWEQGFVDQYGQFMTREEAWIIAEAAGQIRNPGPEECRGTLYSENLY